MKYLNYLKGLIALTGVVLMVFFVASCEKEDTRPTVTNPSDSNKNGVVKIEPFNKLRTCESGDYDITGGMFVFDTITDLLQTFEFLSCADSADIADWRDDHGLKTAAVYRDEMLNKMCCGPSVDRDSIEALIDEYEDYVTVTTTYEGTDTFVEFDVKYPAYAEIVNEDGEFKVQGALIAVTEDGHIISVVDGSTSKMATAKSTMSDDTANGVFIIDIYDIDEPGTTPAGASPPCCDFLIGEQETVGSRRQYNAAELENWSTTVKLPGQSDPYVTTGVAFAYRSNVKTRKKKKFLGITYWTCKRTKLDFERTFEIYHNVPGNASPWTGDVELTTGKECSYNYLDGIVGGLITHHRNVYLVYEFCIDEVDVLAEDTNLTALNAEIHCD